MRPKRNRPNPFGAKAQPNLDSLKSAGRIAGALGDSLSAVMKAAFEGEDRRRIVDALELLALTQAIPNITGLTEDEQFATKQKVIGAVTERAKKIADRPARPDLYSPYEQTTGTFEWALGRMRKGESVRRRGWISPGYAYLGDGHLRLTEAGRSYVPWVPTQAEILATDWERFDR